MNNKGYTRIPNAIIRSNHLTVDEKMLWAYIASVPTDYRFSVSEACATLRINIKTWRKCVAVLKGMHLIEVETVPGKKNLYRVLTPSTLDPGSKTVPLPNETPTPKYSNGGGTHTYKKEHLNNNSTTTAPACAREKLEAELLTDGRIELAMMQHHITVEQYRFFVTDILNDWQFRDLKDDDYNISHFTSVLRIVVDKYKRNEQRATNQQTGDPGDKLDRDAVKAMAALAESSRQPVEPTW